MNTTLTLACWNILYDEKNLYGARHQAERLADLATTLDSLAAPLDVAGLVEVEHSATHGHHGEQIARQLTGSAGFWLPNNRAAEHIGIFGPAASQLQPVDIGDGRTAGMFEVRGVTCCLVHLSFKLAGESIRVAQIERVLTAVGATGPAIIFGDFNSASNQRSRRLLRRAGFRSVLAGTIGSKTSISDDYRRRLAKLYRVALKPGFRADDIYVRDLAVVDSGTFVGDSDHHGVWATVMLDSTTSDLVER